MRFSRCMLSLTLSCRLVPDQMRFLISVLRTIIGYYFCLLFVIQAPVMGYVRNCLTFFCVLLLVAFLNRPSNGDDDDADEDDDSATAASYVLVA
uniref:Uncharacterized protein n=1 Tax=Triticum aestivum TaxID=4565 RepID=A0A3B6RAG5_WHEAT